MSEEYFEMPEREDEEIPAYAMIPAGGAASETVSDDKTGSAAPAAFEAPAAPKRSEHMPYSYADAERADNGQRRAGKEPQAEKQASVKDKDTVKLIPATDDLRSARLRLSGARPVALPDMSIEEDILVPDTRPDLEKILSVTAVPEISRHESYAGQNGKSMLKLSGSFEISVLYLPVGSSAGIVAVNSRIPFRREFEIPEQLSPQAELNVTGKAAEAKVINERKIRITAGASFKAWEYGETEMELLEGARDDSLLLKKERVRFTDMAQRRADTTDIRERIRLKDNYPEPKTILRYEMNVVEDHRQISKGKAVIDASLYYGILYMPKEPAAPDGSEASEGAAPVYVRGKADFTQFLRLPDVKDDEAAGSIVNFHILNSDISLRDTGASTESYDDNAEDDEYDSEYAESGDGSADGSTPYFQLNASIAAGIQVYREIEREVVTDMYHRSKDLEYSTAPYQLSELCGSASSDISIREAVSIPETRGDAASVPYISLTVENITASTEDDRCVIEGSLLANIMFIEDGSSEISCFEHHIPFRAVTDMPGACSESHAECEAGIKDVWFDRVNSRQIDISCGISVKVSAWNTAQHDFIDKVCYVEDGGAQQQISGIVVYMSKPDDTQWSVSKKFRTTEAALRKVNGLEEGQALEPGMRLLIV